MNVDGGRAEEESRDPLRSEAEDLEAVARTLRGDTEAFRTIVESYGPVVRRLAASFLGNREEAEEAAQEIFLKAFRSLRTFRIGKPLLPWLYAIALNHLRTRYARAQRSQERFARDARGLLPEATGDPQEALDDAENRRLLRHAVASLPAAIREAVILHYFGEKNVAEIAAMLGIGTENVKSRLHRGRKLLREKLDGGATGMPVRRYT